MLYDFAVDLIGELPSEFTFIYAIFMLVLIIILIGIVMFPFIIINKIIE